MESIMKMVKDTFLTHRQIGEAEAYYRLIPSLHLSGSNCATLFIHTGFKSNRSSFLKTLTESEASQLPKEKIVTISNKPGKYYTKAISLEDRYDERPEELQNISLAQFAKRFTKTRKSAYTEEDTLFEDGTDVIVKEENENNSENILNDEQDIEANFIISFQPEQRTMLMKNYKIGGSIMRLRNPLVLRFYKYKQISDSHQYYFSQLRLYHPHSVSDLELWESDEVLCRKAYDDAKSSIKYVKGKVMKYQEKVEIAQSKAQEEFDNHIGDMLDATKEQQDEDCLNEGTSETDAFMAPDPDDVVSSELSPSSNAKDGFYKKLDLCSIDFLSSETRELDSDQRHIVDLGVSFVQQVKKYKGSSTIKKPVPPLIVAHGGAGCGKSHVINIMTQWQERILRTSGDNPNHPYILKCAFTGTAASLIEGNTLHHTFSFSFGNEFYSLSDKVRDERRIMLKNLVVLVIDEFSMVKADMLYQLDLRLKELKEEYNIPFGGVALFLFGDLLQLRPTAAKFIFDEPSNVQFKLRHVIESLWEKFQVVNLTHNHRQGNDKSYADVLNRIRIGTFTDEDIQQLETRIIPSERSDIPEDAIFLSAINEDVNKINEARLENLCERLLTIEAFVSYNAIVRKSKPPITSAGTIKNTPLQYLLKLKIGARVMLTYNLDTSDGLTNGAIGEVIGYDMSPEGRIQKIYVHFYDEKVGQDRRRHFPDILNRFPGKRPTPIKKLDFPYSLSKKAHSGSSQAVAVQYPLKLAWAITAHKIQGQTIAKPRKLVVDLTKVFEAAQAYVMLSRVQELDQLFILDSVPSEKIYPSTQALEELKRMNDIALNRKTVMEAYEEKIISINIRSLRSHFIGSSK